MKYLYDAWLDAKAEEKAATDRRREIEDQLARYFGIPETLEGTQNIADGGYSIKVVGRMDRKVDTEKIQEVARENGLDGVLDTLFRWKAELNMAAWKAANPKITNVLAVGITTKPGRPSFSIEKE